MSIEFHKCSGGDFHTTSDIFECAHCTAVIPNLPAPDGILTCRTCGSEFLQHELADARVEDLVSAITGSSMLRTALANLLPWIEHEDPSPDEEVGNEFRRCISAAREALEATKEGA